MSAPSVGQGLFPLDSQWQLDQSVFTCDFASQMVWLSGLLSYGQCAAVFAQIDERWVSASRIWHQTQKHGERLQSYVAGQREQVSVERIQLPDAVHNHDQHKAVSMDGGIVHIRGEGWHALKVSTVFDVEQHLERNPQTQDLDEMAHGVNGRYTAVLGTKADFQPALWTLAVQHQLPTARKRSVVPDGALWIWDVAEDVCPDGQQIVDWSHATEHLSEAAQILYPYQETQTLAETL